MISTVLLLSFGLVINILGIKALPLCQYSGFCRTSEECVAGNKCDNFQGVYYSQCVPDPTTYSQVNCLTNFGGQCTVSSECCDPGAYCDKTTDPFYPQCRQPTAATGKFRNIFYNTFNFINLIYLY